MSGYRAKKRFGQNFLRSETIVNQIIERLDLTSDSKVIEIGAGRGSLTLPLAKTAASIVAVEFDNDLIGYLTKLLRGYDNVELINQDFLTYEPEWERYRIVGNIPYNISSPVIDWLSQHHRSVEQALLMVQREVALRLAASPGSKDWSPLSIFTQMEFDVEIVCEVPPESFSPPPDVVSSVIELTPNEPPELRHPERFRQLVQASFKQRRKQLVNNVSHFVKADAERIRSTLEQIGLEPNVRAEQVSIAQFIELESLL